jgi:cytochrome c oxidase subunit 1
MAHTHAEAHGESHEQGDHAHHEPELGFWRKYVFSTDHKVIGIQYVITGLIFLLIGFGLMLFMRWQLAYPGKPLPILSEIVVALESKPEKNLLEAGVVSNFPKGVMSPDTYNSFGAMHGTIMVFLAIVPVAFAAFGNYVTPLQIGAPDMAFPKLNAASYWSYLVGGVIMVISFFIPGGAAKSGWTSYSPLANTADHQPNMWFSGQTFCSFKFGKS